MGIKKCVVYLLLMVSGNLFAQNTIGRCEYWIDSDFSGRSALSLPSSEYMLYQTSIDIQSLADGLHTIHYRFSDDNNQWSSVASEFFIKNEAQNGSLIRDVLSYEYWIDGDFSNRVETEIAGTQDFSLTANLDIAELINGLHVIHYRFKDSENVWSSVLSEFFVKKETRNGAVTREIISYEYWFDADFSLRTEHSIENLAIFRLADDPLVSGLESGLHTIHYRFKDSDEKWSAVVSEYIICKNGAQIVTDPEIVAYRYWFNNDSITEVALDNPGSAVDFRDTLEMYKYRKGEHYATFQFKDKLGVWSAPYTDTIEKIGFPIASMNSSDAIICDTSTMRFLSTSYDADSLLWTVNGVPVEGDTALSYYFDLTGVYELGLTAMDTVLHIDSTVYVNITVDSITAHLITGESFDLCEGDSMQIEAVSGYSYVWNTSETSQSIVAKDQQWYIVEATTLLNCKQKDSVYVVVHDNPHIDLGEDQSISENESIELDAGPGYSTYLWYDNTVERLKTVFGSVLGIGEHQIFVTVTNSYSCKGSDTITVSVNSALGVKESENPAIKLYPVPVRDHLTIEIPDSMLGSILRIHNASGIIVHEQTLENEINRLNMAPMPSGYYIISFADKEQVYQRTVVLSR